jgi:hypothetical protein
VTDRLFTLIYLLVSSAFTLAGLLALILPAKKYSALGRLWLVGRPQTRGQDLQRRLAGLLIALMGGFAVKGAVSTIFNPSAVKMAASDLESAQFRPRVAAS